MAITNRGTSSANTGSTTSATLSVPIPTGTLAGDLLVMYVVTTTASQTFTTPTNWSLIGTNNTGTAASVAVYYKYAITSEPASTVTPSSATSIVAGMISYYNVGQTQPFDPTASSAGSNSTSTSTAITLSNISPLIYNGMIIWFAFDISTSTGVAPGNITPAATYTTRLAQVNTTSTTTNNVGVLIADKPKPIPGPTSSLAGSTPVACYNGGLVLNVAVIQNFLPRNTVRLQGVNRKATF